MLPVVVEGEGEGLRIMCHWTMLSGHGEQLAETEKMMVVKDMKDITC